MGKFYNIILIIISLTGSLCAQSIQDTLDLLDNNGQVTQRLVNDVVIQAVEYIQPFSKVMADAEVELDWFKKNDFPYSFEAGDTVLIEVRPLKKAILKVEFKNENGGIQYGSIITKKDSCFCKRIVIDSPGVYTLSITNKYLRSIGFFGRCGIKIIRTPQKTKKVFDIVRDTIYNESADSIIDVRLESIDTSFFQLVDYKNIITNTLNIEQDPIVSAPIIVPIDLLDSIQYIVYWIGLMGVDTINFNLASENIKDSIPQAKQILNPVLAKYVIDPNFSLPATYNQNIKYAFTDLENRLLVEKKRKYNVLVGDNKFSPSNFGKINLPSILVKYPLNIQRQYEKKYQIPNSDNYQFYLNFINQSSVNTYPIILKAIGVGFKEKYTYKKVKKIKKINTYKIPLDTNE